ncbi:MAG: DUF479 domain-containing protein [Bacteroidetes bacterium]|nr:DUF479 domain-containing protein [Bacteroidota bacterium]
MNILAHIYLSGENEKLMIGNFIADHVKGKSIQAFDGEILKGIKLHRFIDEYTDSHEVVQQSKQRLYKVAGKYAPVISDVYFDHFLANHWHDYHETTLENYAQSQYDILNGHIEILPERTQQMLPYLIKYNWIVAYRSFEGLQQVFNGMNRRAKFVSNMDQAVDALKADYHLYETEFHQFFPQLKNAVSNFNQV